MRPEILAARPSPGEHLLVYQSGANDALQTALTASGLECRIYGMRAELSSEETDGKLRFLPFSEDRFITDLATSRGVIAGGGFTLMGEAVYLGKPMLAVPLAGQFEQQLNARYLELVGYGMCATDLEDASVIPRFLERTPDCARKLAAYHQDGNRELLAAVDAFLHRAATEPR